MTTFDINNYPNAKKAFEERLLSISDYVFGKWLECYEKNPNYVIVYWFSFVGFLNENDISLYWHPDEQKNIESLTKAFEIYEGRNK